MKKSSAIVTSLVALFSLSLPMFSPVAAQAQTTSSSFCIHLLLNLGEGHQLSSSDASALQQVLSAQGLWNSNTPITSYTEAVASAVSGFQQKYSAQILAPFGLSYGTGYVGAATRAEMNSLYGCTSGTSNSSGSYVPIVSNPVSPTQPNSPAFSCPSGWTCNPPTTAPVTTTYACPTGWKCIPVTSTNPIVPTNPVNQNNYNNNYCISGEAWNGMFCTPQTTTPTNTSYPSNNNYNNYNSSSLNPGQQDQLVTFTKTFYYSGSSPVTLSLLADNGYSVSVNGTLIGASNSNNNYSTTNTYTITSSLVQGSNSLSITVDNQWQSDPDNGFAWQWNPGGLDYSITSNGSTLASSGSGDTATYEGAMSSAYVIYGTLGSWSIIPNSSWIWDQTLYNEYSSGTTVTTNPTNPINPTNPVGMNGSASANLSLDPFSPQTNTVSVTNPTQGQYLGMPVLVFDVAAQGDTLHLHQVSVPITGTGGGSVSAAYLYQGSTPIASASVVNGVATFQNISDGTPGAIIPFNTTLPFTVKADISGILGGNSEAVTASISPNNTIIYSSIDANAAVTGSAQGNTQTVTNGNGNNNNNNTQQEMSATGVPNFSIVTVPTITKSNISAGAATTASFMYSASFDVAIQATGGAVNFGLPGSVVPAFGGSTALANLAQLYINGVPASNNSIQLITSYSQPTGTTLSSDGTYFTVGQNQTVTVPVTYSWVVQNPGANTYAAQLQGIQWFTSSNGSGFSINNSMSNQTNWRTPSI